jgi:thiosulfate/3-mercaptopyruvate sulfurtransferase
MNPLVSASWVAGRLEESGVVVLDATLPPVGVTPPVDTRAQYLARHLPGAVFFDIDELSDHTTALPHMLPSGEAFARSMSALGIGDGMTIVVYEQGALFSAPRAWWMLRSFGAREVYILDGGLRAWTDAGLPTEPGEVHRKPASFHARMDHAAVRGFDDIQRMIAEQGQILDARSAGRFSGAAPEPRPGIRSGHMPGAISVPYTDLLQDGRLKPAEALREQFREDKVDLHRPITTTCGSGVTAAALLLALEVAGARQVSLYDGSWAEYAQHPGAIIETTT